MAGDFLQLVGRRVAGVWRRQSQERGVSRWAARSPRRGPRSCTSCGRRSGRRASPSCSAMRRSMYATSNGRRRLTRWRLQLARDFDGFHGLVHSIAFADYDERGMRPFHETSREQLLRTFDVSCFSLIAICNALKDQLARDASVVTISISTTRMASENYGFMAPVKAALDSQPRVPGQVVQPVFRSAVQRRGAGAVEDVRVGGDPRIRRLLPLCRTGDVAGPGGADRRSGRSGRISRQSPVERHQRPANCRRRRHGGELLRPSAGPGGGRSVAA